MIKRIIFLTLISSSTIASAEIYKCVDAQGNVEFRAQPCLSGHKTEWAKETEADKRERERLEQQRRYEEQQKASQEEWKKREQDVRRAEAAKQHAREWEELMWLDTTLLPDEVKDGILSYLDMVLKDPDSLKDLKWLGTKTDGTNYRVKVFYRAKNGWGAYGISQQQFTTNKSGQVLDMKDLND